MSKPLKKSNKKNKSWGTPRSYWKMKIHSAELDKKQLEEIQKLTPSQRVEWLIMMQDLLFKHYYHKSNMWRRL